jgi:peptide/nickel transport system permease protein
MARFILRRLGLAVITLWLISVLVFCSIQLLPGNVGRSIAGPLASAQQVAALNHKLGTDKPALTQYKDWASGIVHGDFGISQKLQVPVRPQVTAALRHSFELALIAFLLVVPLSLIGGTIAALRLGSAIDRGITVSGLSLSAVPEFVTGILLIVIFGIWLNVLPISATWEPGAGIGTQVQHLLMPAIALSGVLFGYIARMARAGMVEALDSDYVRTAVLKGLPRRMVIWRHAMRNALLPTITVIATQLGYLIGGLVVVEILFNYQGIGRLIFNAAAAHDVPMLEGGAMIVGAVYLSATLIADVLFSLLNPRIRHQGAE